MAETLLDKQKALLEGPILRSLLKMTVPIILIQLLQAAYQLIDAFWVGRLGGNAVAAVSVTTPFVFLSIAVGAGLAIAGSVLIAQYVGAKNQAMVDRVAAQTLLMVVLISITLGAAGYFAAPHLLRLMNVAPQVYEGALGFMRFSFIGLAFNFQFIMFTSFMRGVGNPTVPIYIIMGSVVLNFALDPLFIFGWGPISGLGVMGAAIATLSTQALATVVSMIILFRGKRGIQLQLKNFVPDWKYIRKAFFLGLPSSVEQSMRGLGLTIMTFLIASYGTLSLASYGVGSNILQFVMIIGFGFTQSVSTLVAQNIGAGKVTRAAKIGRLGAMVCFWILTGLGIITFFFAPQLVSFFVPEDQAVVEGGAQFLRIMSLSWGCIGLQLALTGVLKGSGNMVTSMILALVSQWVFQFPLAYLLSHHGTMGITGIWWAFPISNVLMAIIAVLVFAKGDWKKKRLISEPDEEEILTLEVNKETMIEEGIS
ncbi:MAG TPA: MATE family efflux transporter [Flavobacterium sp.]|jgi:putative MATE family efflux protein